MLLVVTIGNARMQNEVYPIWCVTLSKFIICFTNEDPKEPVRVLILMGNEWFCTSAVVVVEEQLMKWWIRREQQKKG